jgi:6-phosphogluconolactonase
MLRCVKSRRPVWHLGWALALAGACSGGAKGGGTGGGGASGGGGAGGEGSGAGGRGGSGGSASASGGANVPMDAGANSDTASGTPAADARADRAADLPSSIPIDPPMRTRAFVYAGGTDPVIRIYRLDYGFGELEAAGEAPAPGLPTHLTSDQAGRFLYATFDALTTGPGKIATFAIDPASGGLTMLGQVESGGARAYHASVHQSGRWLFTVNLNTGNVAVLPLGADGTLGVARPQPACTQAHAALPDPSGQYLFVPCISAGMVAQYRFDPVAGTLAPQMPATLPLVGARDLAFGPGGTTAYALNSSGGLTTFRLDPATGLLGDAQAVPAPMDGTTPSSGAHVAMHPSGRFLFASNRTRIASFAVDPATGALAHIASITDGLTNPKGFDLDPGGRFLVAANQGIAGNVTLFAIEADGKLRRLGEPLPAPTQVGFVRIVGRPL